MKQTVYAISATMIIMPAVALANPTSIPYTGPVQTTTLSEVLDNTSLFSDQDIVLEGKLVKQISSDTFVFSDGVKEINVELDDDIRLNQAINADTHLRIYGEVEGHLNREPEIEVDNIQIL
ncbi:NirD/YgiW/YdeI family stress tolerance protein [Photobacterium sp. SDRW27]|uniref:YgiW/YdeI family stress tolerance OB fold protein n=1 Tax=Photobacterium obscurum TaxID=2829490 RepID=UPI0022438FB9|nr:NirD/YgiW/YdeI family stress tolerance protein [Photobacterium obscurum]MCW8327275.1 NirD/YgiW/YdeI family stress tolerance protein [Photobacterium obscurum]